MQALPWDLLLWFTDARTALQDKKSDDTISEVLLVSLQSILIAAFSYVTVAGGKREREKTFRLLWLKEFGGRWVIRSLQRNTKTRKWQKRDKCKDKNKTQLQIWPKMCKSSKDIFTSSIFFFQEESKNKKRQGGPPRWKNCPKDPTFRKEKALYAPTPPQRDITHPQRGLSCPQHFLHKHVDSVNLTPSKGLLTSLKRQNIQLLKQLLLGNKQFAVR